MPVAKNTFAYSLSLVVQSADFSASFPTIAKIIAETSAELFAVQPLDFTRKTLVVLCRDLSHQQAVVAALRESAPTKNFALAAAADRVFAYHHGGKITIGSPKPLATADDLSIAYTPGVARPCMAIYDDVRQADNLTLKGRTVAVVSDGTAVLGLGDIGPEAALPVMEGKCLLFKQFAGVDAFPICLATKDPDEIVATVMKLAPTFGGINLEDISAPRCFEIERQLQAKLNIPVFHDDQHGTAVVVLAGLLNALKVVGKKTDCRIVINGAGAAGLAIARMLLGYGFTDITLCDRAGIIHRDNSANNSAQQAMSEHTNLRNQRGDLADAVKGADVFIGVSAAGAISEKMVKSMAKNAIVFAMANPTPEIMPEIAGKHAAVVAGGRSDYPNQINNVLAFPGIFRGALDARASAITENMKTAAAMAIANSVPADRLSAQCIIPSPFNPDVARNVASAVFSAAKTDRVIRESAPPLSFDDLRR